mgnify:FL=1
MRQTEAMASSDPNDHPSTLVVGTDGSRAARVGVEFAAELARRLGARVVLVHAMTMLEHLPGRPVVAPHSIRRELEDMLSTQWNEPLATRGVDHTCLLEDGPPLIVLPRVADREDAEMLVVASHGKGEAIALALGSTSHGLLQVATRPVVVVPTRTAVAAGQ